MADILKELFKQDQQKRDHAEQSARAIQSLRPQNDEEKATVEALIRKTAETYKDAISLEGFTDEVKESITQHVKTQTSQIASSYDEQARLERIVMSTITGLGPIEPYMNDPAVEDIIVQRYDNIVIVKGGIKSNTPASFASEEQLITVIDRIVQQIGRQINQFVPKVDARLADGSRVNATIRPISPDGATLTIRKFPAKGFTGRDYLKFGSINEVMLEFLINCIRGKANMMVGGGTGTGKTSLLNMLSEFIPEDELIVTIEDSCELRLKQKNVRRLEARDSLNDASTITIQDLVKNSLRMMVDRVIVGETRDGTVVDLFSAMSTGHEGSMSTIHCNNPLNMVNSRIPTLYSMYKDGSFSPEGQAIQISEALDLIVHIKRFKSGLRAITHITAVEGVDERNPARVRLQDIYRYDEIKKEFNATGYVPSRLLQKLSENGIELDRAIFKRTDRGDESQ
jgi:Flp pilus assembly CpaF family ATPase